MLTGTRPRSFASQLKGGCLTPHYTNGSPSWDLALPASYCGTNPSCFPQSRGCSKTVGTMARGQVSSKIALFACSEAKLGCHPLSACCQTGHTNHNRWQALQTKCAALIRGCPNQCGGLEECGGNKPCKQELF